MASASGTWAMSATLSPPEEYEFFRDLDVFLVLAGDVPTIDLGDLKQVIDRVQPKLVIPMHFRTLRYKPRNMQWITAFLSHFAEDEVDFPVGLGGRAEPGRSAQVDARTGS